MEIIKKIKACFNISTFFKIEIISMILIISFSGYFGSRYLYNNYKQTLILMSENSKKQSKILNINKNVNKFFIYDEEYLINIISDKQKESYLKYYKDEFIVYCDPNKIDKKLIDSLVEKKEEILNKYKNSSTKIKINKSYIKDTSYLKSRSIFKNNKYKISNKIDPIKLGNEIEKFNIERNINLKNIILSNVKINLLIKDEVYRYINYMYTDIESNRKILINKIGENLQKFIISMSILILMFIICIRVFIYDINKIFRSSDRKDSFISSLFTHKSN